MSQTLAALPAPRMAPEMRVDVVAPSQVGRALRSRLGWIIGLTLLAFLGALVFVNVVTPRYTAEARLLLESGDSFYTRPGQERVGDPAIDEQAVASQVQVVMSRDLGREAVKRLGLVGNPEFDPMVRGVGPVQRLMIVLGLADNPLDRAPEERVLDAYYERLLVYPVGKSRIVSVEFRSRDPDLAARAANTIADLYLTFQEGAKKDAARSASTWLGNNIEALRGRVAEAEAKVEAFRARTGLFVGPNNTAISSQHLSDLSTQLVQSRTAQADSQAKARLIRDLIKDGRAFEIPDVANNELIRRLIEQRVNLRAQLALEQRTLLPGHPRVKELTAQLSDLESQIRGAGERTARMLENDATIIGSRVESLQSALDAQKGVVSQGNESEVQLRALEREARSQRDQLESYLGRFREAVARDTDNAVPPDARVVSRAVAPAMPSFPKKLPTVTIITLLAAALAAGVAIGRELLGARPDFEHMAWVPLAATPGEAGPVEFARAEPDAPPAPAPAKVGEDAPAVAPVVLDMPVEVAPFPVVAAARTPVASPDAELPVDPAEERYDFDALIQRLSQAAPEGRGRRVLVTGLGSHDAVDVARGLGRSLARKGRAIVVCVDGLSCGPVDRAGFTDLVAGEASFSDIIDREPGSRLHLVSSGSLNGTLLADEWKGVDVALQAFDQTYEWVIALLHDSADASLLTLLASRMDAVTIASREEPSSPALVDLYDAAKAAGARDVVVARERVAAEAEVAPELAMPVDDIPAASPASDPVVAHELGEADLATAVAQAEVVEPVASDAPGEQPTMGQDAALLSETIEPAVAAEPQKPFGRKRKRAREVA